MLCSKNRRFKRVKKFPVCKIRGNNFKTFCKRAERKFTRAPCGSTLHQPNCIASLCFTIKARFDGNFVNRIFFVYCEEYLINLLVSLALENKPARVGQLLSVNRKRPI